MLKTGNKSDRIDAGKLAELLRAGLLSAVYHGETGIRTLKELSRSYLTISKDLTRVMNRLRRCIEAGPFLAPAQPSMLHAIARNG